MALNYGHKFMTLLQEICTPTRLQRAGNTDKCNIEQFSEFQTMKQLLRNCYQQCILKKMNLQDFHSWDELESKSIRDPRAWSDVIFTLWVLSPNQNPLPQRNPRSVCAVIELAITRDYHNNMHQIAFKLSTAKLNEFGIRFPDCRSNFIRKLDLVSCDCIVKIKTGKKSTKHVGRVE